MVNDEGDLAFTAALASRMAQQPTATAALPNGADNTLIVDLYFGNV